MNNALTVMKNSLQGINSEVDESEDLIRGSNQRFRI